MRPQPKDPFAPVEPPMTIDYVSSVAGSEKTRTAIRQAVTEARKGIPTLFAMPTTDLIEEQFRYAKSLAGKDVSVTRIDHKYASKVIPAIYEHVENATGGHVTFITHEGLLRSEIWPKQAKNYHLIIDEVFDAVLAGEPFKLRDNHWILTSWLKPVPLPPTLSERVGEMVTDEDVENWNTKVKYQRKMIGSLELILKEKTKIEGVVESHIELAQKKLPGAKLELQALLETRPVSNSFSAQPYYRLMPTVDLFAKRPDWPVEVRARGTEVDDVYKLLEPVPRWASEGCVLFTKADPWDLMTIKKPDDDADKEEKNAYWEAYRDRRRGLVTIAGLRRPDFLAAFGHVTVMSALFEDTLMYDVWSRLGVTFRQSRRIKVKVEKTPLGKRRLKLFWLTDESFSKYRRNQAGGVMEIMRLIHKARVINMRQAVCVLINRDDERHRAQITDLFKRVVWMPYRVHGQNRFRDNHQLIFTAALNSYTPDIEFAKDVFDVSDTRQRIARLGMTVYQTMMRLSLRKDDSVTNVTVVVMDKDVAEWLVDHFHPVSQVSVTEIDSEGKLKRSRAGRKPKGDRAKTSTERSRERRAKMKQLV